MKKALVLASLFLFTEVSLAAHTRNWTTWSCSDASKNNNILVIFDTDGMKAAVTICGTSCDGKTSEAFNFLKTESTSDEFTNNKNALLIVPSVTDGLDTFDASLAGITNSCF